MKRSQLVQWLGRVPPFPSPQAALEQVATPPEAAAELLVEALGRGDLEGRRVLDLGSGTGILAMGAARLGAESVTGVERDVTAIELASRTAQELGVAVRWVAGEVETFREPFDTVVMNPPFGAQTRHADRPFWEAARATARHSVYAFALADSRTFIARWAVAHSVQIEATRPVRWTLPATFPHHRKRRVELSVDLWVLRTDAKE
jgi:putative methylase